MVALWNKLNGVNDPLSQAFSFNQDLRQMSIEFLDVVLLIEHGRHAAGLDGIGRIVLHAATARSEVQREVDHSLLAIQIFFLLRKASQREKHIFQIQAGMDTFKQRLQSTTLRPRSNPNKMTASSLRRRDPGS